MFVRTNSILENAEFDMDLDNVDVTELLDEESILVLKNIYEFEDVLKSVTDKNEPYLLSRYLIEVSKNYSAFYNNHKILIDNKETANARICLTYMVNLVLKNGASILGMDMPNKM